MSFGHFIAKAFRQTRTFFATEKIDFIPRVGPVSAYSREKFHGDLRAAMNVTLLALPQAIAYAAIAGLDIIYGVVCASIAAITAPLFASSRYNVLGPTNATAFMLFSFFSVNPELQARIPELLPLLVVLIALISMTGAMLKVADLLQYVSRSVLVGYMAGAAVLIIGNQMKPLLGLSKFVDPEKTATFFGLVGELVKALVYIDWVPVGIGVATLAIYLSFRRWKKNWPAFSISLLLGSAIFGPLINFDIGPFGGQSTFSTFGFAQLTPTLPDFFQREVFNDISALMGLAMAISFLASLENTLMAKSISSQTGDRADVNQDMLSIGFANLASAIAGGMPASGSLTRSMLNFRSGAMTKAAPVFTGAFTLTLVILIAWSRETGLNILDYIPKASLAILVIAISFSLFNVHQIRICLRSTSDDAVVIIFTFLATLLAPLHVAIFIGVAISITLFLRKASKPYLTEYEFNETGELREMGEKKVRPIPAISIVHVEGDLFFGAAELFRTQIQRTVADPAIKVIILRLKNARHLDATSVMALEDLVHFMRRQNLHLLISGATKDVYKVLKRSGILETLQIGADRKQGESNIFLTMPSNPNISTRDALRRAQHLLGTKEADIRIFYDPNKHAN
ncbi:SulP family inorganic anion transporter [Luteolibacter algae]|uniref:SulP family inorganic anion transporter n=1 Tax=Luteolibacter algae TaxID=454151 RepID=A0ABW5D648_9BACT